MLLQSMLHVTCRHVYSRDKKGERAALGTMESANRSTTLGSSISLTFTRHVLISYHLRILDKYERIFLYSTSLIALFRSHLRTPELF